MNNTACFIVYIPAFNWLGVFAHRYAMSVIWKFDKDYNVKDVWYGRTVIRSQYKLYYELAQEIHDGADDDYIAENIDELEQITDYELPGK